MVEMYRPATSPARGSAWPHARAEMERASQLRPSHLTGDEEGATAGPSPRPRLSTAALRRASP